MKKLILLLFLILNVNQILCQNVPRPLLSFPVHIYLFPPNLPPEDGSGFFYADSKYVYLVTAKHVLFDTTNLLRTNIATLYYYPMLKETQERMDVNLNELVDSNVVEVHPSLDIAVVMIGKNDTLNHLVNFFPSVKIQNHIPSVFPNIIKEIIKESKDVSIGDDIFLFGYPTSIGIQFPKYLLQIDASKPILRKGIIAAKNENLKTYILDCPAYPGNSGGPVIQIQQGYYGQKPSYYIIGLTTEFIPYEEYYQNLRYNFINKEWTNSGLSVAIPIDYVLEVIESIELKNGAK